MATTAFQHEAGTAMECLSIPITLEKEGGVDQHGRQEFENYWHPSMGDRNPNMVLTKLTLWFLDQTPQKEELVLRCGFKIGGGIDQDFQKSPQHYSDNGIYCTEVHEGSAAARAGLRTHDKILQCNGYDFTMVTHKKAVDYIKKHPVLNLLVARKGVTHS